MTMIVKPATSFFKTDTDIQLVTDITNVIMGVTDNPSYPDLDPALPVIQAALDGFSLALGNAVNGGKVLTAIKKQKRAALVVVGRELASYLQTACKGSLAVLMSSNFPIHKPTRSPIGPIPTPASVTVSQGFYSGALNASTPTIYGASLYNWRITTAADPTVVLQTKQTTAARASFDGFLPGTLLLTQVNAVGTAGPSDWSAPMPLMVV